MQRKIVSKQFVHKGGAAQVEMDRDGRLYMRCSGCRVEKRPAGMAPALKALTDHVAE
ncbi:hypothetical protein ACFC09_36155 [Streptomyces sp. NPDC056161]|uniref:hypothetical protein n=1 Tax=Streptomyces sp. NPDC056161 TaxID=3345732 RepID=UPI0035E29A36